MNFSLLTPFTKRRTALTVGLIGLLVFGGFLFIAFAGSGLINIGGQSVEMVFTDGLNVIPRSSEVRLNGLEVGRVQSVELRGDDVVAVVNVDGDVELRADASAELKLKNLLGEKYVDLAPGTSSTPLRGPLKRTSVGTDFTQLSSGGPEAAALYEDLARDPVMRALSDAADSSPGVASEISRQLGDLRTTTDELVSSQAGINSTIDNIDAVTSALVGSSEALGRLMNSGDFIQRQIERVRDDATVQFARVDAGVKIINAVLEARKPDIDALTAQINVAVEHGKEIADLIEAGASVPVKIWGLGPLLDADPRSPGPNPWPPIQHYPIPSEAELESS